MVDYHAVEQLVSMGIDQKLATVSLERSNNDITLALEYCFQGGPNSTLDDPIAVASTGPKAWQKVRQRMHVQKQGSKSLSSLSSQLRSLDEHPDPPLVHCSDNVTFFVQSLPASLLRLLPWLVKCLKVKSSHERRRMKTKSHVRKR